MDDKRIVGVDVGGTNIRIGLVDKNGALTNERMFEARVIEGDDTSVKLLGYIETYISNLSDDVCAVSIGFPSTLDKSRTTVVSTPNLRGFDNIAVKSLYEARLSLPVILEKDACMLLAYDTFVNKVPDVGILVGIYIGTGIGNSIMINGVPVVGRDGTAGELGHIPVPNRTDLCSCGLIGCMENYAAGKGLERICAEHFPGTFIKEIFTKHAESFKIKQFIRSVATAVVTEINILNPDYIVLGGGVLAMADFPMDELLVCIRDMTRKPLPAGTLNIIVSTSDNPYNGVIGAGLYAAKAMNIGGNALL